MGNKQSKDGAEPAADFDRSAYYAGGNNTVQLAYSPLGGMPGLSAYHTSVIVNGEEFFFDGNGIETSRDVSSHKQIALQNSQQKQGAETFNGQSTALDQGNSASQDAANFYKVEDFGLSNKTGFQMKQALEQYFETGTYDLLKKNCNSFSDVAIFFLTGKRISKSYRSLENMGASFQGMVQSASGGQYEPNPRSQDFDVEKVIAAIDPAKMWSTPGQKLCDSDEPVKQLTPQEMRMKRLEMLEKQQKAAPAANSTNSAGTGA